MYSLVACNIKLYFIQTIIQVFYLFITCISSQLPFRITNTIIALKIKFLKRIKNKNKIF